MSGTCVQRPESSRHVQGRNEQAVAHVFKFGAQLRQGEGSQVSVPMSSQPLCSACSACPPSACSAGSESTCTAEPAIEVTPAEGARSVDSTCASFRVAPSQRGLGAPRQGRSRARQHPRTGKLGRGRELRGTFQSGTHQRTSTLFQRLVSSFCVLRCIIVCVQAGELHHDRQHRGRGSSAPHAGANTLSRERHRTRLRVGVLQLHFAVLRQGTSTQHTLVVCFQGAHERQRIARVAELLSEVSGRNQ